MAGNIEGKLSLFSFLLDKSAGGRQYSNISVLYCARFPLKVVLIIVSTKRVVSLILSHQVDNRSMSNCILFS